LKIATRDPNLYGVMSESLVPSIVHTFTAAFADFFYVPRSEKEVTGTIRYCISLRRTANPG